MRVQYYFKKILSVVLCFAVAFSCLVFAAVHSTAASMTYSISFTMETIDNADCDDNGNPELDLYGIDRDGTEGEKPIFEEKSLAHSYIQNKDTYTYTGSSSCFPTRIFISIDFDAGSFGRSWKGKFTIDVNGTRVLDGVEVSLSGGGLFSHAKKDAEVNVPESMHPDATSCKFTAKPPATLTVPRADEALVTKTVKAEVTDQYGVLWKEEPVVSLAVYNPGIAIANDTLSINTAANTEDGSDQTVTINAAYQTFTDTCSFVLSNASYTYEFRDASNSKISDGSVKYGQAVPTPPDPVKAYNETQHYNFEGWDSSVASIAKDTVFKPVFSAKAHTMSDFNSNGDATCLEDGTETSSCTCGYAITRVKEGSVLGHNDVTTVLSKPTCTQAGQTEHRCSRCDYSFIETVPALDHNYSTKTHQPTCEDAGYDEHICSRCGDTYEDNFVPSLGHDWNDGLVEKKPSCTETGINLFTCKRCGLEDPRAIEALGHDTPEWTVTVKPTCKDTGVQVSTCERCGELVSKPVPTAGHDWTEWLVETPVTCESDGEKARYCPTCGDVETDVIIAPGHDMQLVQESPTDGKTGYMYFACMNEGCSKIQACVVDEEGHKNMGADCASVEEALESSSAIIPTTTFNQFVRTQSSFRYKDRLASLRIDPDSAANIQPIRFCASMTLPKGAQIVDFGYVYAPETIYKKYIKSTNKFIADGDYVEKKSVINGNYSTFEVDDGTVLTYNVVILCKSEHWAEKMYARPYISFTYAGDTYDIYDPTISRKSVCDIASQVIANENEPKFFREYLSEKLAGYLN